MPVARLGLRPASRGFRLAPVASDAIALPEPGRACCPGPKRRPRRHRIDRSIPHRPRPITYRDCRSVPIIANVKLFHALSRLMLEVIPQDPSRTEYRQGNTLGPRHRHWRRTRIGRRIRLFTRFDTRAKVIVYA